MQLQFWGAARAVTGSMHLLRVNGHSILLECGLLQGKRSETYDRNKTLPFDASEIDACILSHAHIDHSGNLPSLFKNGFRGRVFCTSATRDLCSTMLRDSAHIQESDVAYVNKRRQRQGLSPFKPLYTLADVLTALRHFVSVEYDYAIQVVPGVSVTFRDAGHILGSAALELLIEENGTQPPQRLVFTGDVGRKGLPILRDPQYVENADVLITEGTYGGRYHLDYERGLAELAEVIAKVYKRKGAVLIPAFAVGRTQELVYGLHQLFEAGELPPISIYVDSPLATNVTEIFRIHPECYDEEITDFMYAAPHNDPFGFSRLRYTRSVDESKQLNALKGPAVIISASGMCEGGRILHHLNNRLNDPATTILFVGFQAENTLGRRLLDLAPQSGRNGASVKVFGEELAVRARIERLEGYSAHADHAGLLEYIRHTGTPRHVFIVHAELEAAQALQKDLHAGGLPKVVIPARGDAFEV
ncbi:MAG: MBL fold metallo-hydrolase [Thermoflexales bacterium]|nr:MBL fold metallo-hydrolase [Thermoflexales bacterium]